MELKESLEELRRIGERIIQAGETILPLLRSFGIIGTIICYHTAVPAGTGKQLWNRNQPRRGESLVEWIRK